MTNYVNIEDYLLYERISTTNWEEILKAYEEDDEWRDKPFVNYLRKFYDPPNHKIEDYDKK